MKLNLVTLAVVIIGLLLLGRQAAHLPWTSWRIAGIAIAAPAFLLFVAARIELGSAFSVQAKATTLVTTGVYSRIRNPIYVFGAIFILGVIIWTGQAWLLLIFAVLIPLQVVRSRKEERVRRRSSAPRISTTSRRPGSDAGCPVVSQKNSSAKAAQRLRIAGESSAKRK